MYQLSHALQRKKTMFDNVNIDWRMQPDDGSTDFITKADIDGIDIVLIEEHEPRSTRSGRPTKHVDYKKMAKGRK